MSEEKMNIINTSEINQSDSKMSEVKSNLHEDDHFDLHVMSWNIFQDPCIKDVEYCIEKRLGIMLYSIVLISAEVILYREVREDSLLEIINFCKDQKYYMVSERYNDLRRIYLVTISKIPIQTYKILKAPNSLIKAILTNVKGINIINRLRIKYIYQMFKREVS